MIDMGSYIKATAVLVWLIFMLNSNPYIIANPMCASKEARLYIQRRTV
jgi:hypothetical protein